MPAPLNVEIVRLGHAQDLPLPRYATELSAGMDLLAATGETVSIRPGARAWIPTGIAVAIPKGYEAQVRPRSGLAAKHGLTVLNAPGTIDADYRGEISVVMINFGDRVFDVERGMRIAQLVFAPVCTAEWREVAALDGTQRSVNGFGSTGLTVEESE